jgi:hypothetical protein
VWCVTSLKMPARTHIAHMFRKSFRTHTHMCDRTSHLCVRAHTFATHTLMFYWSNIHEMQKFGIGKTILRTFNN